MDPNNGASKESENLMPVLTDNHQWMATVGKRRKGVRIPKAKLQIFPLVKAPSRVVSDDKNMTPML